MKLTKLTIILLLIFNFSVFSQENDSLETKSKAFFSNDQLVLDFNYDYALNMPTGVEISPYTLTPNIYLMFPIIGKESNISFAGGFGLGFYNQKSNTQLLDTNNISYFSEIPYPIEYEKSKLSLSYFDIPLEIRIKTNPSKKGRSFKIYLGFKAGVLFSSHTKYKGELGKLPGDVVKYKVFNIKNIPPFRYGLTAKIGYGKFMLNGYYSLTYLFDENKGPELTPISLGLTITPF